MNKDQKTVFSHFILTQFNLRSFPKSTISNYEGWVNWTRERIGIFETYCLPSLINQTNKNFKWLIFFDQDTPKEFHAFIEKINTYDFIEICYNQGAEKFFLDYMEEIKSRLEEDTKWIITSRIDNDDCVHHDMVKIIQENIQLKHGYMVSLASGYTFNIKSRQMSQYYYPMSPFITLVESKEKPMQGIFAKGHTKWDQLRLWIYKELFIEWFSKDKRKTRFILKEPLWVQTVHGNNVSNSFYRGLPLTSPKSLNSFGLDISTIPLSLKDLPKYSNYVIWKRYFKCLIVKLLIKK